MQMRRKSKGKEKYLLKIPILIAILAVLFLGPGCSQENDLGLTTAYQALFLDNGQVFIGKLEQSGSAYPLLRDVFYVQRQVKDAKKAEITNLLIKRGEEWHRPDYMRINARHIIMIEPVAPESRMALLIKEAKAANPTETKKQPAK